MFDHTFLLGIGLSATCAIRIRYVPREMKTAYLLNLSEGILTIASKPESVASMSKTWKEYFSFCQISPEFEGQVCTIIIWR